MHPTSQEFYGVDHQEVQRAIARAHRERSGYVVAFLKRLFGRGDNAAARGHSVTQRPTAGSPC